MSQSLKALLTSCVAISLILALAFGKASMAQDYSQNASTPTGEGITAHGHAEIDAKPDEAYVDVSIITESRNQAQAVQQNAAGTASVINALHSAGVTDADMQTQFYAVQPEYDYKSSPAVLKGYQATNDIRVKVSDLTKAGGIIDGAVSGGASQVGDLSFDLSDRTEAEGNALAMAVSAARVKAGRMADSAGVALGRLLSVSEDSGPAVRPIMYAAAMGAPGAAQPQTSITPQQIVITADATLVYAIGNAKQ